MQIKRRLGVKDFALSMAVVPLALDTVVTTLFLKSQLATLQQR